MENQWLALEPIQVLQSLIAEPVTLVAGRPFLVRGYARLYNWKPNFEAELRVVVLESKKNKSKKVDETREPISATIDRSTAEHLNQSNLNDSAYLQLCRNTLDNSVNWLVQPNDFKNQLKTLKPGHDYFLQLEVSDNDGTAVSNASSFKHGEKPVPGNYKELVQGTFGEDFGAFYITGDAELHVNVLGLRYRDTFGEEEFPTPQDHHYSRAHSYLAASFPMGKLNWTSLNLNAPASFAPPFTNGLRAGTDYVQQSHIDTANAFVAAARANDINIGVDAQTVYYGMMNAANNDFEGAASDVPNITSRLAVAVGPADSTTGYYCAHELGHMLGLSHVGGVHQKAENYQEWLNRPQLASNERRDDLLLRMDRDGVYRERLPWKKTVDLMSYGDRTWPSTKTHFELRQRLEALSNQPIGHTAPPDELKTGAIFVSGTYNLREGEGRIQHVLPLLNHPNFDIETKLRHEPKSLSIQPPPGSSEVSFRLSLSVVHADDQSPTDVTSDDLIVRRRTLDFPSEVGMFQAIFNSDKLTTIASSLSADSMCLLTLERSTTVVQLKDGTHSKNYTQLDQTELFRVRKNRPDVYGRIRPAEIDLRPTDDGFGFYLKIDKQLVSNELLDTNFIIEARSISKSLSTGTQHVWRTVGLDVHAGEDVFLDSRASGDLQPTQTAEESVSSPSEKHEVKMTSNPADSDKNGILPEHKDGARKSSAEIELEHQNIALGDLSQPFTLRIRIIATRGLDKVIVFDGLLAQSATRENRSLFVSVGRRHQVQHFSGLSLSNRTKVINEDQVVDEMLMRIKQVFREIEGSFNLDEAAIEAQKFRDAFVHLATKKHLNVQLVEASSREIKVILADTPGSSDPERTVYFAFK